MKYHLLDKLSAYLISGDYASYDSLIQKQTTKMLVPKFDIMYFNLNKAMSSIDRESVSYILSLFDDEKITDKQKESLFSLAFNFYVSVSDKKSAKKYYDKLVILPNLQKRDNYEIVYNVYVEDGYKYLDDMLAQLKECSEAEKPHLCMLIAKMYENKGDLKKKKQYEDMLT